MWNVDVEPLRLKFLFGTVVESGTFMAFKVWNLWEPEFYVETLWALEPFEPWGT